MKTILQKHQKHAAAAFLYLLYLGILVALIATQKTGLWELDEVFSYGLSNYAGDGILMPIRDGVTYAPATELFRSYMAADETSAFRYDIVWQHQRDDVHPPLYYALLHTVCSFFPGQYGKWPAAAVNIVFALGVLFYVRKLLLLLTRNERLTFLASLAFLFSAQILSMATFFRMYVMAMFWCTAMTYAAVRLTAAPPHAGAPYLSAAPAADGVRSADTLLLYSLRGLSESLQRPLSAA